jgi:2-polyprenyl-3-methyl-5-hydroxy-6-metoxy-1,4-benzoquinol methylase
MSRIQNDFDRIALLTPEHDELGPHEAAVLRQNLPPSGERALDIGCGTGVLARRLAKSFRTVVAIDLSVAMVVTAKRQSAQIPNLHFIAADVGDYLRATRDSFDCITAFAVLHHLDIASVMPALVAALRPGGLLLIVDLVDSRGIWHLPVRGVAWFVSRAGAILAGVPRSRALNAAWHDHGASETYLTFHEAQRLYARLLPGARVRQHLLWRYSVVWRKPG